MNQETANYDEPWKEALSEYFEPFLCFFFPEVHQLIDWTKVPQSLDKKLKRITTSSKTKNRFADKLYKVWLHSYDYKTSCRSQATGNRQQWEELEFFGIKLI
jgi:hypothetical protein